MWMPPELAPLTKRKRMKNAYKVHGMSVLKIAEWKCKYGAR